MVRPVVVTFKNKNPVSVKMITLYLLGHQLGFGYDDSCKMVL